MKKLILVLVLLFSTELTAHAQSCVNEHGAPPVSPMAQEVSTIKEYNDIIGPTQTSNSNSIVLVEFYLGGCCYYNGEVALVNELMQIYGSSLKVIEIEMSSEAGSLAWFDAKGSAPSPQFHLMVNGHSYRQVGALQGNIFENWINNRTGLGGSTNINSVNGGGQGCISGR